MKHHEFDLTRSVTIRGAPFTFRSLHGPDARFGEGRSEQRSAPLDRMITITLPAIWVLHTMEVIL